MKLGALVTCEKWDPQPRCGNGLHGWLKGEGDLFASVYNEDSKWLVVEPIGNVVEFEGKCKFESCRVRFVGTRGAATAWIKEKHPEAAVIFSKVTAGNRGTAVVGYGGTATACRGGNAIAGDEGTAVVGSYGVATAGNDGAATAGNGGTAVAGNRGTATAGKWGTILIKY